VCMCVVLSGSEGRWRMRAARNTNGGKKIILVAKSLMKICGNPTKTRIGECVYVCTCTCVCVCELCTCCVV